MTLNILFKDAYNLLWLFFLLWVFPHYIKTITHWDALNQSLMSSKCVFFLYYLQIENLSE